MSGPLVRDTVFQSSRKVEPTAEMRQAGEDWRQTLLGTFEVAVQSVLPGICLPAYLPTLSASGNTLMIAVGKAAASMAEAAIRHYGRPLPGLVLTRYGHGVDALDGVEGLQVVEAGHPIPDAAGAWAAARVLELVSDLGPDDHLLFLVSGGGSSLLAAPAGEVSLADKQIITRRLLECGATIEEINCVRKHLSGIKGGRLALAAAPARITTLAVSDVAGDDPALIASGPTLPDRTTLQNAQRILDIYDIEVPGHVAAHLGDPENETPGPDHPAFETMDVHVVARSRAAISAASQRLHADGFQPVLLGDDIEGDATEVGTVHAALALHYLAKGGRYALISGGECTVSIRDRTGAGGPNAEYLLALAIGLQGARGVYALACDTDGIDGTQDNAGAMIDPTTPERAKKLGLDLPDALSRNRSYKTFEALGDLVKTGPTRTNVNDLRIILVDSSI